MNKKPLNNTSDILKLFRENKGHPMKIILGLYRGEAWTLVKTTFFLALQNSPEWLMPIVTANIINIATNPQDNKLSMLILNSVIMAVFIIQNTFSNHAVSVNYDRLTRKQEYLLRSSLIQKLQELSIGFHKNTNSGKLQSKIMRDCEYIETFMANIYRLMFHNVVYTAIAIVVTINKSPIVILFFLAMIPLEVLVMRLLRKQIRTRNADFRKETETTQSNVSEMIELIPVTRAHGLQNQEIKRLNARFKNVMDAGFSLDKTNYWFGSTIWVISTFSQMLCLSFTAYLAYIGKISVGEVVLYQTYFGQIVARLNSLIGLYPQLTKGFESVNSISEVLCEDDIEVNNRIIPIDGISGGVVFHDIFYKYPDGDRWILRDFNLTVKPGESVAFVGGSGAGKSTILNLLIGFDTPQEGDILIDRMNMKNLDLNQFRKSIAVVPQNTILFAGSVRDNITYGTEGVTDDELIKVLHDVGLYDLVMSMPRGLDTHLGEHGGKLSGGQRQRISIARALLRKPKIIIFDEATSALDSESEKLVQQAVDNMMKQCTTFLVAHRLSTIKNADRIAVISEGRISEIGSYDELMELKGQFYNLKKMQE